MSDRPDHTSQRLTLACPETSEPAQVDVLRTPCGAVIATCSRLGSNEECTRACAARVDELDRRDVDDARPRVLVVYSGHHGQTKTIALGLAGHFRDDGLTTELADADVGPLPPPADYDVVVIGSSVGFGRHPHSIIEYIVRSRDELRAMPAFFFSVGHLDDIERMYSATGWRPTSTAVFERTERDRRRFLHKLGGRPPSTAELAIAESSQVRTFALAIGEETPESTRLPQVQNAATESWSLHDAK